MDTANATTESRATFFISRATFALVVAFVGWIILTGAAYLVTCAISAHAAAYTWRLSTHGAGYLFAACMVGYVATFCAQHRDASAANR